MTPTNSGPDRARMVAAYRRIHELGKEAFDCAKFRELYLHFFARELTENALDRHLVCYACADPTTMLDYLRFLEYHQLRHERRHRLRHSL